VTDELISAINSSALSFTDVGAVGCSKAGWKAMIYACSGVTQAVHVLEYYATTT
jgi:hypothetical protein